MCHSYRVVNVLYDVPSLVTPSITTTMSVRPIDHDIEQPMNAIDQFSSSNILMQLHCHFPLFTDEVIESYYLLQIKHINGIVFIPTAIVYMGLFITQCGLIGLSSSTNDDNRNIFIIRVIAISVSLICNIFSGVFCTYHYLRYMERIHEAEALIKRVHKWFPYRLEDVMTLGGVCIWSLLLIGRMLEGQCPTGTKTFWSQQTCNPFANHGGIPSGMVSSLYSIPFLAQLCMKCVSIPALVLCYMISFSVVVFCVFYTTNSSYHSSYPDCIIIALFITATFEITRLQRLNYLDLLKSKEQEELAIDSVKQEQSIQILVQQLKLDRAEEEKRRALQQLQLDRVEDEKRLKEAETVQLRSLIGNVVHDLKTPLFAIEADLDMLKTSYSFLPESVVHEATVRMHQQFNLVGIYSFLYIHSLSFLLVLFWDFF